MIVVDASVVVKLLVDEELTNNAAALFESAAEAGRPRVAPSILPGEVTNAIYQRYRRGDLTSDEADEALARFADLGVEVTGPDDLYQQAFAFARAHRLPATYDSHYVVLAHSLNAELWTDDRRLLMSLQVAAPWVRWIGDYPANGITT